MKIINRFSIFIFLSIIVALQSITVDVDWRNPSDKLHFEDNLVIGVTVTGIALPSPTSLICAVQTPLHKYHQFYLRKVYKRSDATTAVPSVAINGERTYTNKIKYSTIVGSFTVDVTSGRSLNFDFEMYFNVRITSYVLSKTSLLVSPIYVTCALGEEVSMQMIDDITLDFTDLLTYVGSLTPPSYHVVPGPKHSVGAGSYIDVIVNLRHRKFLKLLTIRGYDSVSTKLRGVYRIRTGKNFHYEPFSSVAAYCSGTCPSLVRTDRYINNHDRTRVLTDNTITYRIFYTVQPTYIQHAVYHYGVTFNDGSEFKTTYAAALGPPSSCDFNVTSDYLTVSEVDGPTQGVFPEQVLTNHVIRTALPIMKTDSDKTECMELSYRIIPNPSCTIETYSYLYKYYTFTPVPIVIENNEVFLDYTNVLKTYSLPVYHSSYTHYALVLRCEGNNRGYRLEGMSKSTDGFPYYINFTKDIDVVDTPDYSLMTVTLYTPIQTIITGTYFASQAGVDGLTKPPSPYDVHYIRVDIDDNMWMKDCELKFELTTGRDVLWKNMRIYWTGSNIKISSDAVEWTINGVRTIGRLKLNNIATLRGYYSPYPSSYHSQLILEITMEVNPASDLPSAEPIERPYTMSMTCQGISVGSTVSGTARVVPNYIIPPMSIAQNEFTSSKIAAMSSITWKHKVVTGSPNYDIWLSFGKFYFPKHFYTERLLLKGSTTGNVEQHTCSAGTKSIGFSMPAAGSLIYGTGNDSLIPYTMDDAIKFQRDYKEIDGDYFTQQFVNDLGFAIFVRNYPSYERREYQVEFMFTNMVKKNLKPSMELSVNFYDAVLKSPITLSDSTTVETTENLINTESEAPSTVTSKWFDGNEIFPGETKVLLLWTQLSPGKDYSEIGFSVAVEPNHFSVVDIMLVQAGINVPCITDYIPSVREFVYKDFNGQPWSTLDIPKKNYIMKESIPFNNDDKVIKKAVIKFTNTITIPNQYEYGHSNNSNNAELNKLYFEVHIHALESSNVVDLTKQVTLDWHGTQRTPTLKKKTSLKSSNKNGEISDVVIGIADSNDAWKIIEDIPSVAVGQLLNMRIKFRYSDKIISKNYYDTRPITANLRFKLTTAVETVSEEHGEESLLDIKSIRIGELGKNVETIRKNYINSANIQFTVINDDTPHSHTGLVDWFIITNTELSHRNTFMDATDEDDEIIVDFQVKVSDHWSYANAESTNTSIGLKVQLKDKDNVVTAVETTKTVTVTLNDNKIPQIQVDAELSSPTYLVNELINLNVNLEHKTESTANAYEIETRIHVPYHLAYNTTSLIKGRNNIQTEVVDNEYINVKVKSLVLGEKINFSVLFMIEEEKYINLKDRSTNDDNTKYLNTDFSIDVISHRSIVTTSESTTVILDETEFFEETTFLSCNITTTFNFYQESNSYNLCYETASESATNINHMGKVQTKHDTPAWLGDQPANDYNHQYLQVQMGYKKFNVQRIKLEMKNDDFLPTRVLVRFTKNNMIPVWYPSTTSNNRDRYLIDIPAGRKEYLINIVESDVDGVRVYPIMNDGESIPYFTIKVLGVPIDETKLGCRMERTWSRLLLTNEKNLIASCMRSTSNDPSQCSISLDNGNKWIKINEHIVNLHFIDSKSNVASWSNGRSTENENIYGTFDDGTMKMRISLYEEMENPIFYEELNLLQDNLDVTTNLFSFSGYLTEQYDNHWTAATKRKKHIPFKSMSGKTMDELSSYHLSYNSTLIGVDGDGIKLKNDDATWEKIANWF
ncbi:hypothetical protein SNEBB_003019 [Seison nebaliae]|nr:hypothetical protein SNEBB_003019 [Seison nebaliae]